MMGQSSDCSPLGVTEIDSQPARCAHKRTVGIDLLRSLNCFGERDVDNPSILPSDHAIEAARRDQVDCVHAEG